MTSKVIRQSLGVLTELQPSQESLSTTARIILNYAVSEYQYYGVKMEGAGQQEKVEESFSRILEALHGARITLRKLQKPNAFKVVAALTVHLIATNPFRSPLPESIFGALSDKPTAVISYHMCVAFLLGVKVHRQDGKTKVLCHPIKTSIHYLEDLVRTLWAAFSSFKDLSTKLAGCYSDVRRSELMFQQIMLVSLIYEAIAYQTNKHVSYRTFTRVPLKQ